MAAALGLTLASTALADELAEAPPPSPIVDHLAGWVVASDDNHGLPYIVIDKVTATVSAYDRHGNLKGETPALLGLAQGDDSVTGIGDREMMKIHPQERTTPAGRFVASFGMSRGKGRVLWVDYSSAISLHPVITTNKSERRLQRLKSPTPDDNRISYGCINVAPAFYQNVVRKLFRKGGLVYVLPDTKSLDEVFPSFAVQARAEGWTAPHAADAALAAAAMADAP